MRRYRVCASVLALFVLPSAQAMDDAALHRLLSQRWEGDRTGACVAAAVVGDTVARAVVCADPKNARRVDADTAFEIGSVSKTMTAALLAGLVAEGKLGLDDPLARHLPDKVKVPEFEGRAITLRHLLTHTSGLPSLAPSWAIASLDNPYRSIGEKELFAGLSAIALTRAPGEQFDYSNLGVMLLSWVVANAAGSDFEALIRKTLFEPLGMRHSFVDKAPKGTRRAQGHLPNGSRTSAWDFRANTAGVGGVRASLNDMVRYLEAQLGRIDAPVAGAIATTHETLTDGMAWGWMIAPFDGSKLYLHEGGTGGFAALVAFDADRTRGVVVLADTSQTSVGGLGSTAFHLLDDKVPLGQPRRVATPEAELVDALVGEYRLGPGLNMAVRRKGEGIEIQASGQPAFEMRYDSAGDFYPLAFDATLRPARRSDGDVGFTWLQGGGAIPAQRIDPDAKPVRIDAERLADYAGTYPLMPGFSLRVFVEGDVLKAQATGQGSFALDARGNDSFGADAFGIELVFARDEDGKVDSLKLHQGGQTLTGQRQ